VLTIGCRTSHIDMSTLLASKVTRLELPTVEARYPCHSMSVSFNATDNHEEMAPLRYLVADAPEYLSEDIVSKLR
jgi:hypothetical protein